MGMNGAGGVGGWVGRTYLTLHQPKKHRFMSLSAKR